MKIRIKVTDGIIKLLTMSSIGKETEDGVMIDNEYILGGHLLEDMALILGISDKAIPNTKEDADGMAFPDEIEKELLDLNKYIRENRRSLEFLIHQNICTGLKPGNYEANDYDMLFKLSED